MILLLLAFIGAPITIVALSPADREPELTAQDFELESATYPPDSANATQDPH